MDNGNARDWDADAEALLADVAADVGRGAARLRSSVRRAILLDAVAVLAALVVVLAALPVSPLLSMAAFVGMVAATMHLVGQLRLASGLWSHRFAFIRATLNPLPPRKHRR